jgi:hypothetical protein
MHANRRCSRASVEISAAATRLEAATAPRPEAARQLRSTPQLPWGPPRAAPQSLLGAPTAGARDSPTRQSSARPLAREEASAWRGDAQQRGREDGDWGRWRYAREKGGGEQGSGGSTRGRG